MKTPEYYESDALFFFAGRPSSLTVYRALFHHLKDIFPEASVKVQKSQISFYGSRLFAMVSLPRRKREDGITVSFGLGHRVESSRIAAAVEAYPNRWTHHISVSREEEIDEELLGWLREAWEFSETKRRHTV